LHLSRAGLRHRPPRAPISSCSCRLGRDLARRRWIGWPISLRCDPGYKDDMAEFLSHGLVPIAVGAVAVVLLLGLINMMRGGSGNTSQKLMRLRVLLQFVAIVVIMVTIWVIAK
jgi:Hypoxia induced protein conserved region